MPPRNLNCIKPPRKTRLKSHQNHIQKEPFRIFGESITIEVAIRKGIAIYDASYVALALIEKVDLYTADEKLLMKTGGSTSRTFEI